MISYKGTLKNLSLQYLLKDFPQDFSDMSPENGEYTRNLIQALLRLPAKALKVFNYLMYKGAMNDSVYSTQTRIGQMSDGCRETANRHVARLHEIGLIVKTNRGIKKTCIYELSDLFKQIVSNPNFKQLRYKLCFMFSALKKIYSFLDKNLLEITPPQNSDLQTTVTQSILLGLLSNTPTPITTTTYRVNTSHVPARETQKRQNSTQETMMNFRPLVLTAGTMVHATDAGKARLESFDDHDIQYAIEQLQKQKNIEKPFNWFVEVCKASALKRGVKIDWARGYRIANRLGIEATNTLFEEGRSFTSKVKASYALEERSRVYDAQSPSQEDLERGYRLDGGQLLRRTSYADPVVEFYKWLDMLQENKALRSFSFVVPRFVAEAAEVLGQEVVDSLVKEARSPDSKSSDSQSNSVPSHKNQDTVFSLYDVLARYVPNLNKDGSVVN